MNKIRRHDLDWLRLFAFTILIYFHAAVFFVEGGIPQIQNTELSFGLQIFVEISSQFRLPLLFFISGIGVAFSTKTRTNRAFIMERTKRLLIPLFLGIIFVVPPMVYTEKLFLGTIKSSFIDFYSQILSSGVYPQGSLSWHHLWFIAYLFIFCAIGTTQFDKLKGSTGQKLLNISQKHGGFGIYYFTVLLIVVEIFLRPIFPGARDLIHDWASFIHWYLVFLSGYFVANNLTTLKLIESIRRYSLSIAIASTLLIYLLFGTMNFSVQEIDVETVFRFIVFSIIRIFMVWSCLLTCVGFASRYLNFQHPILSYLNEAVYPFFILHLTILTILAYWIVQLPILIFTKYLIITSLTVLIVLAIYHLLIKPFNLLRIAFGMKKNND